MSRQDKIDNLYRYCLKLKELSNNNFNITKNETLETLHIFKPNQENIEELEIRVSDKENKYEIRSYVENNGIYIGLTDHKENIDRSKTENVINIFFS